MDKLHLRRILAITVALAGLLSFGAITASAKPIKLLTFKAEFAKHKRQANNAKHAAATGSATSEGIVPPPMPCPLNGLAPQVPVMGIGIIPNCGIPELPIAAGEPYPGTMSYYGGHVQVHPKQYLVLWGWGVPGAFDGNPLDPNGPKARPCSPVALHEGTLSATLPCDPDGAGKYMADFVHSIGGSQWAEVQDQYYQTGNGTVTHIDESGNLLAGIWVDDGPYPAGVNPNLAKTSSSNAAGPTNTYTEMALEASRAAAHFGLLNKRGNPIRRKIDNANIIIAQPQSFSDPQAANSDSSSLVGYCAFHDYTDPNATGNSYYKYTGVVPNMSYTNMPYTLNAGSGCGPGLVNTPGTLDAFSIGLGHEIEETATDPGAEDVENNILSGGTRYLGGWYDTLDGNENGDKCAYVGLSPVAGVAGPNILPIPGAMNNVTFPDGKTFAVQSLWSDAAAFGTGWCAGAGDDFPQSPGTPPYS
jgi:hypothetical protein